KRLAALGADEIGESHENAMFIGDVANEALPAAHARRSGYAVRLRTRAASRRRRGNEDDLRGVERGNRGGQAMPRILAHEHCGASPGRIEGAHAAPSFDEPLLVEQTVGRQEHLPVYVPHDRLALTECDIERAVIESVVPDLVKSDDYIDRRGRRDRCAIRLVQIASQGARRERVIPNTALEEVAGEGALGQREHHWP